jgi:hypothetical protein
MAKASQLEGFPFPDANSTREGSIDVIVRLPKPLEWQLVALACGGMFCFLLYSVC